VKRALVAGVLVICLGASAGAPEAATPKPDCFNGLLAFASLAPDAYSEIYSISFDGRRRDVSRTTGSDSFLQPSPDGSKVAYWTDGQLVVANADGSDPRQIPGASGQSDASPTIAWSPDSRRFALTQAAVSRAVSGTYVAVFDLTTGHWTAFSGLGVEAPQWSPDGTAIAVDSALRTEVSLLRLDGTRVTPIAPGTLTGWSPDGKHLLIVNSSGQAQVVSVAGGAPETVAGLAVSGWTPDSSRLLGISTNLPDANTLETVAIDGSDPRVIAQDAGQARLSPDGRRVVFLRRTDQHVVVTDLDGNIVRDFGAWNAGPYELHKQFEPYWSPNGREILYWSGGKIFVADDDRGTLHALAGGAAETVGQHPAWAADGSAVFDDIIRATGNTDIYIAHSDGHSLRRVFADHVSEGGPVWSPDGKRLAFIRYGTRPSLVVTDLAGHTRTLTTLKTRTRQALPQSIWGADPLPSPPAWSPDGTTIAVATRTGVKLVNVRSRTVRPWHRPPAEGVPVAVAWSRQGALATTDGLDESSIWITRSGRTQAIGVNGWSDPNYGDVSGLAGNLAWSPDGNKLAYLRYGAENGTGYFAWVWDSIRVTDTTTLRTRAIPADEWGFSWSPDGRYLIEGGVNTLIARADGQRVATLAGLRAIEPSWQPLCRKTD
jgi:TolB protein